VLLEWASANFTHIFRRYSAGVINVTRPIWGQHLILDLAKCPRNLLVNEYHLRCWVKELVAAIDMVSYGEPQLEHFAAHSFEAAGYTLLQLIETSNICAHFAENLGQVYIDIFSCKSFDNDTAESVCSKYFEPQVIERHLIDRGAFESLPARAAG
jgi:S-adenosylmethionine/arginine decarboxylase-like enzyme